MPSWNDFSNHEKKKARSSGFSEFIEKRARIPFPGEFDGSRQPAGTFTGFDRSATIDANNGRDPFHTVNKENEEKERKWQEWLDDPDNFINGTGRFVTGTLGSIGSSFGQWMEEVGRGNLPPPVMNGPWIPRNGADPKGASMRVADAGKFGWKEGNDPVNSWHAWSQLGSALADSAYNAIPGTVGIFSGNAADAVRGWQDGTWLGNFQKSMEGRARENEEKYIEHNQLDPSSDDYQASKNVVGIGRSMIDIGAQWPLLGMAGKGFRYLGDGMKALGAGSKAQKVMNVASKAPKAYYSWNMFGKPLAAGVVGGYENKRLADQNMAKEQELAMQENDLVGSITPEERSEMFSQMIDDSSYDMGKRMEIARLIGYSEEDFKKAYMDRNMPLMKYVYASPEQRADILRSGEIDVERAKALEGRIGAVVDFFKSGQNPDVAARNGLSADEIMLIQQLVNSSGM